MGRRSRRRYAMKGGAGAVHCAALLLSCTAGSLIPAHGQVSSTTSRPTPALPEPVRAALGGVSDFALNFDHPGFYAVRAHVASNPAPACEEALRIDDWRTLLERPSEFRGRLIEVTGTIGRNRAWTLAGGAAGAETTWQLELSRPDQPLALTAILTQSAEDLALGSEITLCGWFVMIRQYHDERRALRPAGLLVAKGPTRVTRASGGVTAAGIGGAERLLAVSLAVVGGLAIGWLLLRSATRRTSRTAPALRAAHAPSRNLSAEFRTWAEGSESPAAPQDDAGPRGAPPHDVRRGDARGGAP